jgi:hypothetical protein
MKTRLLTLASLLASALVATGVAVSATTFPDRPNDQTPAAGPDIRSVTLSHTRTTITFRVRFATAPSLGVSRKNRFRFSVAAAREGATSQAEGGVDLAPDRGTFRYPVTG